MQIVICAMAKNEHLYINDWVNYYLKIGFDKIYLYDNDEIGSPKIEDFIERKDRVEIIDIRGIKKPQLQHEIYTEFYNTHKFDWCLFCDIDEFLVGVKNVHYWLEEPRFRRALQIRVKWKLFGDDDLIERDMSVPVYKAFNKEVTENTLKEIQSKTELAKQGKCFVRGNLHNIVIKSTHFASIKRRDNVIPSLLPSGRNCWSKIVINEDYSYETVFLNHYMTKTLSEFINQKLNRNDAVHNVDIKLDYFWKINKKTQEKLDYLKKTGL